MISIRGLSEILHGHWVVFDPQGRHVDLAVPGDVGPAAMLVVEVTDALKRVGGDGRIVESVDRSTMWAVAALVLNEIVLARLDDAELTVDELLEAVRSVGFSWQIRPISVP